MDILVGGHRILVKLLDSTDSLDLYLLIKFFISCGGEAQAFTVFSEEDLVIRKKNLLLRPLTLLDPVKFCAAVRGENDLAYYAKEAGGEPIAIELRFKSEVISWFSPSKDVLTLLTVLGKEKTKIVKKLE